MFKTIAVRVHSKLVYGSTHPYGEFITEESLNNISLKDVNNYYETFAKPNNPFLLSWGMLNLRR